jgi:endonuclease-3 related protein
MRATREILDEIYRRLYKAFGPQHWWPGETPFEVIIGAILTQNTAWRNVEKAIKNLKKNRLLTAKALNKIPRSRLARLIRSTGYYNQKAKKLKNFIQFLFDNYGGSLKRMFAEDFLVLRAKLLGVNGIGLETADSILLYAANKPMFVVDAYTRRILSRHNLIKPTATYSEIQDYFMDNLENEVNLFNEFHALLVRLGKDICKAKPNCRVCPLRGIEKGIRYFCDSCSKQLPRPQDRYILEVKLYAAPEVEITQDDLNRNLKEEMRQLIEQTRDMDKKKLEEEVYVSYKLCLCKKCRDTFNMRLKHREFV